MKRIFSSLILVFGLCLSVYAVQPQVTINYEDNTPSQYPKGYITAMQSCTPFVGSQTIYVLGLPVINTKKILGKRNGYCITEEITYAKKNSGSRTRVVCNISDKDRKELVSAMMGLTTKDTYTSPDGSMNYKGTPDGAVMTRFYSDPKICKTYSPR